MLCDRMQEGFLAYLFSLCFKCGGFRYKPSDLPLNLSEWVYFNTEYLNTWMVVMFMPSDRKAKPPALYLSPAEQNLLKRCWKLKSYRVFALQQRQEGVSFP